MPASRNGANSRMASRRSDLIGVVADFDDPAFFGDTWAQAYPDLTFGPDPASAVEFLAALADDTGRVLELGIGGGGWPGRWPAAGSGSRASRRRRRCWTGCGGCRRRADPGHDGRHGRRAGGRTVPPGVPGVGRPVSSAEPGTPVGLLPQRGTGAGSGRSVRDRVLRSYSGASGRRGRGEHRGRGTGRR